MKINNKKVIVATLALAMGAALAGSISGSVAWYQYSTRAATQVSGTSAGTSRNLQVRAGSGAYAQSLNSATILANSVQGSDGLLIPVGAIVESGAVSSFVGNPVYQYENLPAIDHGFIEYNLGFKCEDTTKNGTAQVAKNVYLTGLNVTVADNLLLPAVRIAISDGTNKYVLSKTEGETATKGNLDMNYNSKDDTDEFDLLDLNVGYDANDSSTTDHRIVYSSGTQEKYATTSWDDLVTTFGNNPYTEPTASKITTTKTSGDATVNVKIWLEGWQSVNSKNCWDLANTINKSVQVDMRFEVKADQQ